MQYMASDTLPVLTVRTAGHGAWRPPNLPPGAILQYREGRWYGYLTCEGSDRAAGGFGIVSRAGVTRNGASSCRLEWLGFREVAWTPDGRKEVTTSAASTSISEMPTRRPCVLIFFARARWCGSDRGN